MPVPFDELNDSPKYRGSATGLGATRRGHIAWGDINAHYAELFPGAVLGVPQLPKLLPGSTVLYAADVDYEPYHPDGEITNQGGEPNTYDMALAAVTYATIPYEQHTNGSGQVNILTRRVSASGEMMTMPNSGFCWVDNDDDVDPLDPGIEEDISPGKLISYIDRSVTLHRVPEPDEALFASLMGCVNDAEFDGIPTECALFIGYEMNQTVTSDGSLPWEVELKILERRVNGESDVTWNHSFQPSSGLWKRIKGRDNKPVYKKNDFGDLY